MTTLAEARRSESRYHTFDGRPRKVVSGRHIDNVRPKSNRPEVLMDAQIEIVQELQEELEEAMISLLQAKSEQEASYWSKRVNDLKDRSEELVLILKVVAKLNSELVYAKAKVRDTLRKSSDVVSTRKRISWLEERMGRILKKYFADEIFDKSETSSSSASSPRWSDVQQMSALDGSKGSVGDTNQMAGGDATTILPVLHSGAITSMAQQHPVMDEEDPGIFITANTYGNIEGSISPKSAEPSGIAIQCESPLSAAKNKVDVLDHNDNNQGTGGAYWLSPHHRFDFNKEFDTITRENPLSYHNLGLAVTSSFVEPVPKTAPQLSQGEVNNAEFDNDKLAMEKISERINEILEKMENAAMESAEYKSPPAEGRQYKLLDIIGASNDATLKEGPMVKNGRQAMESPKLPTNGAEETPTSYSVTILPPVGGRVVNPNARSLKYYPKPVPSPEVLPVTRTNKEKKYPRLSSEWNDTPPEEMVPTIRLVNQMDVFNKTSLIARRMHKTRAYSPPRKVDRLPMMQSSIESMVHGDQGASVLAGLVRARCGSGVRNLDKEGAKWERVMMMLSNLESGRVEERRDTARNFGDLDCCEPSVITALNKRLEVDDDPRVRYESAKSMISLGFWSPLPVTVLVKHLKSRTHSVKLDVVRTITAARNVHAVDKSLPAVEELIATLGDLCASTSDDLAYSCALCLGRLGVTDQRVKDRLLDSLRSEDTHVIAMALEILVRLFNPSDPGLIGVILSQLQNSPVWKHRSSAAKLLTVLGTESFQGSDAVKGIPEILRRRLYDDPSREVRTQVASTLTALGLRDWIVELVQKELFSENDDCRAHAVISVGVLGLKKDRTINVLLDLLELDPCEYVRLQVIRTFTVLGATNSKVIRALRERERAGGLLASEATKAIRVLNVSALKIPSRASRRPRKMRSVASSLAPAGSPTHRAITEV